MKLFYKQREVLELSDLQKQVIRNDIPSAVLESDMTRRCKYWLESPVEKWAHRNKKVLVEKLKSRGMSQMPVSLVNLAEMLADNEPPPHGLEDIVSDDACAVGSQKFMLSQGHRKVWRKMLEPMQRGKQKAEYVAEEEEYLGKRMGWILYHKYERCMERLKLAWLPVLEREGVTSIPVDDDVFASLIFARADYKDRDQRDAEEVV